MIIFFYGADSFRIKQKLDQIRQHFTKSIDLGSFSLEEIDGEKASVAELSKKISTGSLFTKKRMVIIKNIFNQTSEEKLKQLLVIVKNQAETKKNVLVFIDSSIEPSRLKENSKQLFNFLKKQPYAQEFKALNNQQTLNFAKKLLQDKEQKITSPALSLLVAKTGNDLWRLHNEINKLSALALGRQINLEDVNQMISGSFEEKIFALIDAFFEKRKSVAYKILHEQFSAGLSSEYILNMLIRQIRILLEIKSAQKTLSSEKLATALKLHPYVVKKSLIQANRFDLEDLKTIFNNLIHLDYKSKSGQADLKNELFALAAEGLLF